MPFLSPVVTARNGLRARLGAGADSKGYEYRITQLVQFATTKPGYTAKIVIPASEPADPFSIDRFKTVESFSRS